MGSSWIARPRAFIGPDIKPRTLLATAASVNISIGADFWAGNVISKPDIVVPQLDFAYIRAGQGGYIDTGYKNTSAVFKGQKPRGPYWVYDPRVNADTHIGMVMKTIDEDSELPIWIDVELSIAGKSAANYWDDLSHILGTLTKELGYRPVLYTGLWFWEPNMYRFNQGVKGYPSWQSEFKFALAEYPYNSTVVSCTWAQLKSQWLPQVRLPRLGPFVAEQIVDWQFSGDKFILPGIVNPLGLPNKLDLDYIYDLNSVLLKPGPAKPPVLTLESIQAEVDDIQGRLKIHGI